MFSITAVGIGKIITLLFRDLTLFQASLFPAAGGFIYAIIISAGGIAEAIKSKSALDSYLFDDLLNEDDEDYHENEFIKENSEDYYNNKITPLKKESNLNALCPCGSGKKYKNCCKKNNKNHEE
jgi:hypothetical protein